MNKKLIALPVLLLISSLTACAPEVGSDAWCEDMKEKSKGDWTVNEAREYAKSCIFDSRDDD